MPPLKNLRQERFCVEYAKDQNGTRSYKAAGYKYKSDAAAAVGATQLIRIYRVKDRILELEKAARSKVVIQATKAIIDRAWVINRLVENVDRSMQVVEVLDAFGRKTGVYKYRGDVANTALGLIGKDLGMFAEKALPLGNVYNNTVNFYLPRNARDERDDRGPKLVGNGSGNGDATGH